MLHNHNTTTNNNNFIYTLESEVKLHSVVCTIITYSNKSCDKNINTFINDLHSSKTDRLYH